MRLLQLSAMYLGALLTLTACAPLNMNSVRMNSEEGLTARAAYTERISEVARQIRAICSVPANQLYYTRTPCLPSGLTEKHLADRSRINKKQKAVAERIFKELHELNENTREFMIATGHPEYISLAWQSREIVDPQISALQASLLAGEITWGEYNRKRFEIYESSMRERTIQRKNM